MQFQITDWQIFVDPFSYLSRTGFQLYEIDDLSKNAA